MAWFHSKIGSSTNHFVRMKRVPRDVESNPIPGFDSRGFIVRNWSPSRKDFLSIHCATKRAEESDSVENRNHRCCRAED